MNLLENDIKREDIKTKKIMKGITITIVLLLVISIGLFFTIYYLQGKELKFTVNNKSAKRSHELCILENEKLDIS